LSVIDLIPVLGDKELATLRSNATRLAETGDLARRTRAAEMIPLIDAELADRKAKAPPPAAKAKRAAKAKPAES